MTVDKKPFPSIGTKPNEEDQLIGLALVLATVNACDCKVCKMLRKAQKDAIEAKVEGLKLD